MKTKKCVGSLVVAAGIVACSNAEQKTPAKEFKPITAPSSGSSSIPAADPGVAGKATNRPEKSSVSVDVDPESGFLGSASTISLEGPAFVYVNKQPSGMYNYDFLFFPAGSTATCEIDLAFGSDIPGKIALAVSANDQGPPKPGMSFTDTDFQLHFMNGGKATNGGLFQGLKVDLSSIDATSATGEISGKTGSTRIAGAQGKFVAKVCYYPEPETEDAPSEN